MPGGVPTKLDGTFDAVESMPGFFQALHDVLPLAAAGEALRSIVYFGGTGLARHLIVRAVGLVVGLVLAARMSVWLWFLFDVLIGVIGGHVWTFIGVGALTIFSMSMAASVVTRTLGMAGVPIVVAVLMLAGAPALDRAPPGQSGPGAVHAGAERRLSAGRRSPAVPA